MVVGCWIQQHDVTSHTHDAMGADCSASVAEHIIYVSYLCLFRMRMFKIFNLSENLVL